MMAKQRFTLAFAEELSGHLLRQIEPYAERIEIAGSVRRRRPDPSDIELLYIPKVAPIGQLGLFGEVEHEDLVERELLDMLADGELGKRMNEAGHPIGFGKMNKALVHISTGMGIDVFRTTRENWGMAMVVRTGPADWNVEMMSAFQRLGMSGHAYGGVTGHKLEAIACPDEATVFGLLGLPYIEPERRDASLLRAVRA
jgi:DNA polymerase (family 10)